MAELIARFNDWSLFIGRVRVTVKRDPRTDGEAHPKATFYLRWAPHLYRFRASRDCWLLRQFHTDVWHWAAGQMLAREGKSVEYETFDSILAAAPAGRTAEAA